ncbi:hypothetical protein ACSSNL_15750 [Thalassobius sp. S69A]|uniref:hypothetical protein n=1 Tax=unclassified Thalassovita TaxID=2619711 RepID=UPI003C7EBE1D
MGILRVLAVLAAFGTVGCTQAGKVHRTGAPQDQACQQGDIDLGKRNKEGRADLRARVRCSYQGHVLPAPDPRDAPKGWTDLANEASRSLTEPDRYDLAFVELAAGQHEVTTGQMQALRAQLKAKGRAGLQNVVVTYVHGWRHDAAVRDADVLKLRMVLGYTRAALNSRCIERGDYCNASLTGVFVGWRGRSFNEPVLSIEGGMNPFAIGAIPTVWDRKDASTRLGQGAGSALDWVLRGVQGPLHLMPGNAKADKMLVFAHSFGGNMMTNLMRGYAEQAIDNHPMRRNGARMDPLIGDLVVLLNPATQAQNWTAIQRQERRHAGLSDDQHQVVAGYYNQDRDFQRKLAKWQNMYPSDQRPIYISMTSTPKWHGIETRGRRPRSDFATGTLFPLARRVAGFEGREQYRTIGHLNPLYTRTQKETDAEGVYPRERLAGPPVGASHEFSVNQGIGRHPSYADSMIPDASWCTDASGWLTQARQYQVDKHLQSGTRSQDGYWDYGLDERFKAIPNVAAGRNPASVQWRHSLWLPYQKNRISVASSRSPFWNVRALDTAIKDHHGWVSYPMWCAINQLVLDDVTARRPGAAVRETLEAQQAFEAEVDAHKRTIGDVE